MPIAKKSVAGDREGRARNDKATNAFTLGPYRSDDLDCGSYYQLIDELETREPTMEDFDRLAAHEATCPTGEHTEAGVEEALDLPRGALRHGSPDHELPSPGQLIAMLIRRHL